MFRIDIEIDYNGPLLSGLDALDERRRLGLPDGSVLLLCHVGRSVWVEVDEAFARQHFDRTSTEATATIPVDALQAGDLGPKGSGLQWAASPDRIKALFAAHYKPEVDTTC